MSLVGPEVEHLGHLADHAPVRLGEHALAGRRGGEHEGPAVLGVALAGDVAGGLQRADLPRGDRQVDHQVGGDLRDPERTLPHDRGQGHESLRAELVLRVADERPANGPESVELLHEIPRRCNSLLTTSNIATLLSHLKP